MSKPLVQRPRCALQWHAVVLFCYGLLTCLLTWPLPRKFTTHVPGNGIDDPALAWNLWWLKERLVNQLKFDIFHVDWMFHPIDINLAFYTLTPLNGLISIPLQSVSSLIVSNNLILLSTYILGGYGAFLLCYTLLSQLSNSNYVVGSNVTTTSGSIARWRTQSIWFASIFGGIVYAFASAKLFYAALGQFNIASSQWVPFCILYLLRIQQRDDWYWRWRNSLLCALFLVLQAWSELTYASFLVLFIVMYAGWTLISIVSTLSKGVRSHGIPYSVGFHIVPFVLLALFFVIGISPFLAAMVPDLIREGDFFASGGGFASWFSADLVGYLLPTRLHPFVGDWVAHLQQSGFSNDVGQHIYLGYVLLALIVSGLLTTTRRSRHANLSTDAIRWGSRPRFWFFNLVFFWLLTLGSNPLWFGQRLPIVGPFALVSQLPFFSGNRYPSRYSIMVLICAAVLASYGLFLLMRQIRIRRHYPFVALAVGSLFLIEHLSMPLPLNLSTVPPIYQQIAAVHDDVAVLELPTGWRNGAYVLGKSDKQIMMQQWYQTVHSKRRLGGNTSRNPWYKFEYFVNAPLLGDLIGAMNADQEHFSEVINEEWDSITARSQKWAPSVLGFLGVGYVSVRVEKSPRELLQFVEEVMPVTLVDEWTGIDWDGELETVRLYQVEEEVRKDRLGNQAQIYEIGDEMGALYLAEGWSSLSSADRVRYALRDQAHLLLDLPSDEGTLEIDSVFNTIPMLSINGHPLMLDRQDAHDSNDDYRPHYRLHFQVPAGLAVEPVDRVVLHFDGQAQAFDKLVDPPTSLGHPIGETGATLAAGNAIVVMSAGAESGKFARIYFNGEDVAVGTVGYNLVAVAQTGELLDAVVFNTNDDLDASDHLATWLAQWPNGTIIAGAVADSVDTHEATMLGESAVTALQSAGVVESMRGKHRWGHAFIGSVGAAPSTALETAQLIGVVKVAVGSPIEGMSATGGIKEVRFIKE